MMSAFMEGLLSGRILLMVIGTIWAGYVVGIAVWGGWTTAFAVVGLLFTQLVMFTTADYTRLMLHIGSTGSAGINIDTVLMMHIVFHPAVLIISFLVGDQARVSKDADDLTNAQSLSATDVTDALNILGSHPSLASAGWFPDRWLPLSEVDRVRWVSAHLDDLQTLWYEAGDGGFENYGINLPMHLMMIDTKESNE